MTVPPDLEDRLGPDFFERDVLVVARELLGCVLVAATGPGPVAIRLTETEAYGGSAPDPGSHAHRSRTPRNDVMFRQAGLAYVYRSYGIHWCMNLVVGPVGQPAAVLLRAGEVVVGHDTARRRRETTARAVADRDLARGPGRLCTAAGISGVHYGLDVTTCDAIGLWRRACNGPAGPERGVRIATSSRTGVAGPGGSLPYRFFLADDPTVSPHRPLVHARSVDGAGLARG